jgi:hypothetical protein
MKKLSIVLTLLTSFSFASFAQSTMLEQDVNQDTIIEKKGPNRLYFTSSYISAGSIFGNSTADSSVEMATAKSWEFKFGFSFKIRANNFYSVVLNTDYSRQAFFYEPQKEDVKYDKLIMNNLGLGVMNRFNFGKRGNRVGNYLEVGASGQYGYMVREKILTEKHDKDAEYKSLKASFNSPNYVNRFNYYGDVRLGFGHYIVYGRYLLSDILNDKANGAQLPALTVGLMYDIGAK